MSTSECSCCVKETTESGRYVFHLSASTINLPGRISKFLFIHSPSEWLRLRRVGEAKISAVFSLEWLGKSRPCSWSEKFVIDLTGWQIREPKHYHSRWLSAALTGKALINSRSAKRKRRPRRLSPRRLSVCRLASKLQINRRPKRTKQKLPLHSPIVCQINRWDHERGPHRT